MAKKSNKKVDLSQKSREELEALAKEQKSKIQAMRLNIGAQNQNEMRELRRSTARTLTALKQK